MKKFIIQYKIFLLFFFLFCSSIFAGYKIHQFFSIVPNTETSEEKQIDKIPENKTLNFLLIGVDEREDDVGRADTIIVLSTNLATHKIGLISIPRDSYVAIPNHGNTKINHSYAYGGAILTKQMVEKTLNLKIDNVVLFNFDTFKKTIDLLGGIDLFVEKDMFYRDDYDGENGLLIDLKQGEQHLDGEKSIEYVRYRDEEGDIGRVERQQNFVNALLKKITNPSVLIKIPSITKQVFMSVKTTITFDDLLNYISYLKPNQKYDIKTVMVPGEPIEIDEISYWKINQTLLQQELKKLNNFVVNNDDNIVVAEKDNEKGIFKEKTISDELDVEIEKLDKANKNNFELMKQKLLDEEAEEKEKAETKKYLYQQNYLQNYQNRLYSDNYGVIIINTSDDVSKADFAVNALQNLDIDINFINNKKSGKSNRKTIFIVSNKNEKLISILKSLPFSFSTIYKNDTDKSTLIIGDDFYK